jgi:hypothetical protein
LSRGLEQLIWSHVLAPEALNKKITINQPKTNLRTNSWDIRKHNR